MQLRVLALVVLGALLAVAGAALARQHAPRAPSMRSLMRAAPPRAESLAPASVPLLVSSAAALALAPSGGADFQAEFTVTSQGGEVTLLAADSVARRGSRLQARTPVLLSADSGVHALTIVARSAREVLVVTTARPGQLPGPGVPRHLNGWRLRLERVDGRWVPVSQVQPLEPAAPTR